MSTVFQQLGIKKFVDTVKFNTAIVRFREFHNELPSNLHNYMEQDSGTPLMKTLLLVEPYKLLKSATN